MTANGQLASFGRLSTISNCTQTSTTTCDQPEDDAASVLPFDAYPLCGFMFCCCGQPFVPWGWADRTRTYLSLCGCRLRPIEAAPVEHRVEAAAELPPVAPSGGEPDWAALHRLFARVEVGGTVEDLRLVHRT